jgi:hypothetical protein
MNIDVDLTVAEAVAYTNFWSGTTKGRAVVLTNQDTIKAARKLAEAIDAQLPKARCGALAKFSFNNGPGYTYGCIKEPGHVGDHLTENGMEFWLDLGGVPA